MTESTSDMWAPPPPTLPTFPEDFAHFDAAGLERLAAFLAPPAADGTPPPTTAIATAPRGMGLTTLAEAAIERLGLRAIWISHSERRIKTTLQELTASPPRCVTGQRTVAVLDSLDALLADPGTSADVQAFLRSPTRRVLALALAHEAAERKGSAKGAAVAFVRFPPPPAGAVEAIVRARAPPGVGDAEVRRLVASAAPGDLAACLGALRTWRGESLVPTSAPRGGGAVAAALEGASVARAVAHFGADPEPVLVGVHEAMTSCAGASLAEAAGVAECLSVCAHLLAVAGRDECDDPVTGLQLAAGVGLARASPLCAETRPPPAWQMWTHGYRAKAKAKQQHRLRAALAEKGGTSTGWEDLAGVRQVALGMVRAGDAAGVRSLGLDEAQVLALMRLWSATTPGASAAKSGPYTQSKHAEVKRWLAGGGGDTTANTANTDKTDKTDKGRGRGGGRQCGGAGGGGAGPRAASRT